ncbi:hypothetical protein [Mycobacterium lepromatosis]
MILDSLLLSWGDIVVVRDAIRGGSCRAIIQKLPRWRSRFANLSTHD